MSGDSIRRVQKALKDKGFDPGEIDGVWGRRSIAALKAFQAGAGLAVDGIPGPLSRAALLGADVAEPPADGPQGLVWIEEALHLLGTREGAGKVDNPVILNFAKNLDIDYPHDDTPWCGLFVAHCIGATLPEEALPASPLWARGWTKFGEPTEPRLGAVLVFWRGKRDGSNGHVGFYCGEDGEAFHVLGGNQSDMVSKTRIGKNRLLAARWPRTAASLASTAVVVDSGGIGLSHKES